MWPFLFFSNCSLHVRNITALISFLNIFFMKEGENKSRLSYLLTTLGLLLGNLRSRSFFIPNLPTYFTDIK